VNSNIPDRGRYWQLSYRSESAHRGELGWDWKTPRFGAVGGRGQVVTPTDDESGAGLATSTKAGPATIFSDPSLTAALNGIGSTPRSAQRNFPDSSGARVMRGPIRRRAARARSGRGARDHGARSRGRAHRTAARPRILAHSLPRAAESLLTQVSRRQIRRRGGRHTLNPSASTRAAVHDAPGRMFLARSASRETR
jgi:hypothetical protein